METDRTFLRKYFEQLPDEEFLDRFGSVDLTDAVRSIAADEIVNTVRVRIRKKPVQHVRSRTGASLLT